MKKGDAVKYRESTVIESTRGIQPAPENHPHPEQVGQGYRRAMMRVARGTVEVVDPPDHEGYVIVKWADGRKSLHETELLEHVDS